jgi:AcrR family transcriptional regulator
MRESVSKRGRPRLLDREAGLEVAARLFWEHGYEGTSIADLTKAMGIAPPSLYAAFGSKEQLYQQALEYNAERENKHRLDLLNSDVPAYEALAFYLHDAAREFTNPAKPRGCMVSNAVLQHAKENDGIAESVAARRTATTKIIKTRLDRAITEGELPDGTDTLALAHFYVAVVQGMSAQACDGLCEATLMQLADLALSAWPGRRSN